MLVLLRPLTQMAQFSSLQSTFAGYIDIAQLIINNISAKTNACLAIVHNIKIMFSYDNNFLFFCLNFCMRFSDIVNYV